MRAEVQVSADFARCFATGTAAVLIGSYDWDGERTDAQACVIVTCLIFAGVLPAVVEWGKAMRDYCRPSEVEADPNLPAG